MPFLLKVGLTALIVAGASELAKRHPGAGAILASLPLTSLLVLSWLWVETGDASRVEALSWGIFWAVLPSLTFFAALPLLMRAGAGFWTALAVSSAVMAGAYAAYAKLLTRFGVSL